VNDYSDDTKKYLSSFPRKVADKLIEFEMKNKFTQQEAAKELKIDFEDLVKVEFNFPGIEENVYEKVLSAINVFNRQQRIIARRKTNVGFLKSVVNPSASIYDIPNFKDSKDYQIFDEVGGLFKERGTKLDIENFIEDSHTHYNYESNFTFMGVK
jgi:hypothetical protein